MVFRRSTTLCTWAKAFSKAARSIVSFMVEMTARKTSLRTPRRDRDRFVTGQRPGVVRRLKGRARRAARLPLETVGDYTMATRFPKPFRGLGDGSGMLRTGLESSP